MTTLRPTSPGDVTWREATLTDSIEFTTSGLDAARARPAGVVAPCELVETVGGHDAECAAGMIKLQQSIRLLESQAAARDQALRVLNQSLLSAHADVERLREHLRLADEALRPAEMMAVALQERLDGQLRPPGTRGGLRLWRKVKRRLAADQTAFGAIYRVVRRPFRWLLRRI